MQEKSYNLTYDTEAMNPVKVGEPSIIHQESLVVGLDLINELRDKSKIYEAACKLWTTRRYNTKVRPRSFHKGDLV